MRIAVIGAGVSGLVCAHRLHRRHDLTVFEAGPEPGGHVVTVPVGVEGRTHAVDMGFIVFNRRTYPRFVQLLDELGVASQPSDMSFGVRCERTGFEYGVPQLRGLFAQPRNLWRPSHWRFLRELVRFQTTAARLLDEGDAKVTLGDYLEGQGYSSAFVERYVVPMGAAIWSAEPGELRRFPARTFVRFFANHGLLNLRDRPRWRVVRGGSRTYVDRLVAGFRDRIRLATPVREVRRQPGRVLVRTDEADWEAFDRVVIATHSDQALAMLSDPSDVERHLLGAVRYQENEAVLHTDARLLPRARHARASWNYHIPAESGGPVAVTYHMNRLQGLDAPVDFCVTLNRSDTIDETTILRSVRFAHPIFDPAAIAAQTHHSRVSGVRNTHYCGAWWGYGFHEDGVASADRVVAAIEDER